MFDFNKIVDKVRDTANVVADKTVDIASKAGEKAKQGSRIAKLTVEIKGEEENMKKAYLEMGKLYYETCKDSPDGFFVQLCDEITLAKQAVAAKEAEIAELKAAFGSEGVDVEFEEVVSETEAAEGECHCGCCEEHAPETPCCDGEPCDCENKPE